MNAAAWEPPQWSIVPTSKDKLFLDCRHQGELVESAAIDHKSTYILGRNGGVVDIVLDHPSSSRKHAALIHGPKGVLLLDLGSSHGTFLNGTKLSPFDYQVINPKQDTVIFGASTKVYSFRQDHDLATSGERRQELDESSLAAKRALAMSKAAQLISQGATSNVVSVDDKKKALWGGERKRAVANRWESAELGNDAERNKFRKLMGLKNVEGSAPGESASKASSVMKREKQDEIFRNMEHQYEQGLRHKYGGGSRGLD